MKKNDNLLWIVLIFCLIPTASLSQSELILKNGDDKEMGKYLTHTRKTMEKLNRSIEKTNHKYIKKYKRFEKKYFNKLCKTDPLRADKFAASYDYSLLESPKNNCTKARYSKINSSYYDTLRVFTHYLSQDSLLYSKELSAENLNSSTELEATIEQSNKLQAYFRKQKAQLKNSEVTKSIRGKELRKMDELNYYYSSTVANRMEHFDTKMFQLNTSEAYSKILKTPEFNNYLKKNSKLAKFSSLTNLNSQDVKGSQTLAQAESQIANQISNMESALSNQLKNKTLSGNFPVAELKGLTSIANLADVPSFHPNQLKSLKTSERITYRANWQFAEFRNYYPGQLNLDVAFGYELIKRNIFGGGINYFTNLGSSWGHMDFSTAGYGFNIFYEYKLIQSIFLNLIYERNYFADKKNTELNAYHVTNKKNVLPSDWQNSLLLGLKIKQHVKRMKGSATMSFCYDVLNEKRYAPATPFVYKVGWEW